MSLEAIVALLGHRSPRMTLVYARISDSTVAEQCFTATHAVEADTVAAPAPAGDSADDARLHRRLLGNGHCTRPLELDCRFQTICEGCGFYETGPQFVTVLRRQRDDAAAHTDLARTQLYDQLIHTTDDADGQPPRNRAPRSPESREPRPRGHRGAAQRLQPKASSPLDTGCPTCFMTTARPRGSPV